jgi:DNA-binding CsgD family transcriptional regulator
MTSELLRIRLEHTEELERLARRAAQTQAELVAAIQTASRDGMSNREIARAAGLSHPTVAKIAAEPEKYGGRAS